MKFYGTSKSRSARSLWALEEVGAKYEHIPTEVAKAKSPEILALNPNGHIPVLEDNGTVLWESMAINMYVAVKYGKAPFCPDTIEGRGEALKWSFFGVTEIEPHLMTALMHRVFLPADQRDDKAAQKAADTLQGPLKIINNQLNGREYLLGKDFTIADLNVASVLSYAGLAKIDMTATPNTAAWLQKCLGREANQRVRKLG